jgi:hypothetical protein
MSVYVCSLKTEIPQVIPADGQYHIVRFPYGSEPYDALGMHSSLQPDGVTSAFPDERSGLIWPVCEGWGSLTAMVYWEAGGYTEIRDRFVRDPLGLTTGADSTATEDHAPTPGGQYRHKCHAMFVHLDTPLALMVRHNDCAPRKITLAEFKLAIHL